MNYILNLKIDNVFGTSLRDLCLFLSVKTMNNGFHLRFQISFHSLSVLRQNFTLLLCIPVTLPMTVTSTLSEPGTVLGGYSTVTVLVKVSNSFRSIIIGILYSLGLPSAFKLKHQLQQYTKYKHDLSSRSIRSLQEQDTVDTRLIF